MRQSDDEQRDQSWRRSPRVPVAAQTFVAPGHLVVPAENTALGAVVSSTVAVTLHSPTQRRGGVCHYLYPLPRPGVAPTPIYGKPAVRALIGLFLRSGCTPSEIMAGIYGGACPEWANPQQLALAKANIKVAQQALTKAGLKIMDEDVGGKVGRKLWYVSATNEVAVIRTLAIRNTDWFPSPSFSGGSR